MEISLIEIHERKTPSNLLGLGRRHPSVDSSTAGVITRSSAKREQPTKEGRDAKIFVMTRKKKKRIKNEYWRNISTAQKERLL